MTPESKALDAFLSACMDGGMSGQAMGAAMRSKFSEPAKPPTQPAWHDQPTQPGLWLCNEGDREVYTWVVYAVSSLPSRLYQPDGETRWYGPIPLPEDTK